MAHDKAQAPDKAVEREGPEYTTAVGEAADRYFKSVAFKGEYHLPARARFHELFDAMLGAALAPSAPIAAPVRETESPPQESAIAFGNGDKVVDVGSFYDRPAVFIASVKGEPGKPGNRVAECEKGDPNSLEVGETVLTFPTTEQARTVADALMGLAAPARDDGARERIRNTLVSFVQHTDVTTGFSGRGIDAIDWSRRDELVEAILASLPAPAGDVPGEAQTQPDSMEI